jgi:SOS response regulatory protein OraA/RecX
VTHAITALHERRRDRIEVELDGVPWRVLPARVVVRTGLCVGRRLDRDTARLLAQELRRTSALTRAEKALAVRDRSRQELDEQLARSGVPSAARVEVLATLGNAGLVDDARVAQARAGELARRGYGDAAIRHDLRRRQLSTETVEEAVAALEPELGRAQKLLASGGTTPRLLRRLSARGFSRETLDELAGAFAQEP